MPTIAKTAPALSRIFLASDPQLRFCDANRWTSYFTACSEAWHTIVSTTKRRRINITQHSTFTAVSVGDHSCYESMSSSSRHLEVSTHGSPLEQDHCFVLPRPYSGSGRETIVPEDGSACRSRTRAAAQPRPRRGRISKTVVLS